MPQDGSALSNTSEFAPESQSLPRDATNAGPNSTSMGLINLLSNSKPTPRLLKLEIRPDEDCIFIEGDPRDAETFRVKGTLVLMTSENLSLKNIKLSLRGKMSVRHDPQLNQLPAYSYAKFFEMETEIDLGDTDIRHLKPGNYEFPYHLKMPTVTPESIEGDWGNWITYELKAVAERRLLLKDIIARKAIRIARVPARDTTSYEVTSEVIGHWPDKINYSFTNIPKQAIFGDQISTDVTLTPLLEKLQIGKITVKLMETRRIRTPTCRHAGWEEERPVCLKELQVPAGSEDNDPILDLPMSKFRVTLQLPTSLKACKQSADTEFIRIRHTIWYQVLLKNPDGHMSELKAHQSIKLFFSPHVPFGPNNTVRTPSVPSTGALSHSSSLRSTSVLDEMMSSPPTYGEHRFDPMYEEHRPEQTQSTATGTETPNTELSQQSGPTIQQTNLHQDEAEELRQRLHDIMGTTEASAEGTNISSSLNSGPSTAVHSRANSISGLQNAIVLRERINYNMEELDRQPSYETALRCPIRTPFTEVPPVYDSVTA